MPSGSGYQRPPRPARPGRRQKQAIAVFAFGAVARVAAGRASDAHRPALARPPASACARRPRRAHGRRSRRWTSTGNCRRTAAANDADESSGRPRAQALALNCIGATKPLAEPHPLRCRQPSRVRRPSRTGGCPRLGMAPVPVPSIGVRPRHVISRRPLDDRRGKLRGLRRLRHG